MNDNPINRRDFAVTMLAAGFTRAFRPVSAEPIITDTKDLTVGEVMIPVKYGTVPAGSGTRLW